jgi:hypothetical protein
LSTVSDAAVGGGDLVAALAPRRCEVIVVPMTTPSEVMAAIDGVEAKGAVRHLLIAAPWSASADWVAARESAVHAGYFACQRWLAARQRAGDTGRSTLTAVTGLGGDFGIGGAIGSAVGVACAERLPAADGDATAARLLVLNGRWRSRLRRLRGSLAQLPFRQLLTRLLHRHGPRTGL